MHWVKVRRFLIVLKYERSLRYLTAAAAVPIFHGFNLLLSVFRTFRTFGLLLETYAPGVC